MSKIAEQTQRSVEKEGLAMLQVSEQRFPCSSCAAHGEAAVSLQHMGVHGGAKIHLHSWEEPTPRQVDA